MPVISLLLLKLQKSSWRLVILRHLLDYDNHLRRWITFFAMEKGIHPKHRLTRYHDFFLDHISANQSVLDVGCGAGYLAYDIASKSVSITGIDINPVSIKHARRNSLPNIKFIVGDATVYTFPNTFDVLVLSNVLEHIQNRPEFLKKLKHLAPKILIRVPMIDRDWTVPLKKEMNLEYCLDPTHEIEYTESIFRQEMAAAKLCVQELSIRWGEIYAVVTA